MLTDIDDTLTEDGRLPAASYQALEALHGAGLLVIPITGRPAGWCDMIARFWPVDAVVGENGALYFRYDRGDKRMIRRYAVPEEQLIRDRARLARLGQEVLARVPGAAIAADQFSRMADLAIDFREDVPPLATSEVDRIREICRAAGAAAKISSIHVNAWFGDWDKLTMVRRLMAEQFAIDIDAARERLVFVGDAPNDEPLFRHFPNAVGVANLRDFADRMEALPAWIADGRGGAGFVELTATLLAARNRA